ncbi:MAG: hypothetical protein IAB82_06265 [Bacteroidetes bacterium]|uniref:Calcineurin-like phosphoesterase N-terminal domain-containing protein n=1 Tax=Candidatus Cryptobacteroides faecavium TaxID=2840762 RepID=A0A9D9IER3_9BACT|nr:hypothetical protein [Candidatus Cryptobacteroides faecavium]
MCDVSVSANGRTPQGQVFVSVTDSGPVEQKAGYTSYGRVIDYEGNPVPGVAVSDGEIVTTTDDKGQYYLRSEKEEGFVFISVPKNYRVAVNRTVRSSKNSPVQNPLMKYTTSFSSLKKTAKAGWPSLPIPILQTGPMT